MRSIKASLFSSLLAFSLNLQADSTLYMLPYEQNEALKSLISGINAAKSNINIAIYSFTHRDISKALKDAASRGVRINIIFDRSSNIHSEYSAMGYLSKYRGINTCMLSGREARKIGRGRHEYEGIMHQKLALIDNNTIFLGSANWSKNAFENNYELLMRDNNPAIIQKAQSYFKKMWAGCQHP